MTDSQLIVYLNNCQCRDHATIYGDRAFYDLNTTGRQANEAVDLREGQECVVATKAPSNQIVFKWYSLLCETRMRVDTKTDCRVFFGDFLTSEIFSKEQAAREELYSVFFDKNGNLKAGHSVFYSEIPRGHRPTRRQRAASFLPEEVSRSTRPFLEGATRQITGDASERNDRARAKCIEHYGATCAVCGMSFANVYGPTADGFIHVHHLKPLSDIDQEYEVDPIADLRPVCPNCHAVIHLGGVARNVEEVRGLLRRPSQGAMPNRRMER